MAAGDGASEQSRLAAERIARLKRQLDQAERAAETWGAGAEGERRTASRLGRLTPDGWFMLHDVHWPGRPLANLDHVLVGPGGVVVVDAKNWSGSVEVRDGVLRQNGYSRNPAVDGALGQAAAVAALLGAPHRRLVRSIICLTGHPDFAEVTESGVEVLGINRVVARIAALPAVLDPQTVVGLYSHLGQQLTQPQAPAVPDVRGNAARNPVPRPYQRGAYPSPVPARIGYRSAASPPQLGHQASTGKLAALLWSLLVLGIVAFSLAAPLWSR
ncbi:hypothetical protein JOE31_000156 [Arthrobacter sp. PvP023]|uniref:nuclease-related domain-containing protein n=1 Tax=Micrococcaceae TaxID=1268 RepID=UPI001AE660A3|nr:nuclease-related domain-containing protein [Arthrobacter sp. PvP023]MBP1133924.1 hypothetical protein [Arthrobacter sp. PvP023]